MVGKRSVKSRSLQACVFFLPARKISLLFYAYISLKPFCYTIAIFRTFMTNQTVISPAHLERIWQQIEKRGDVLRLSDLHYIKILSGQRAATLSWNQSRRTLQLTYKPFLQSQAANLPALASYRYIYLYAPAETERSLYGISQEGTEVTLTPLLLPACQQASNLRQYDYGKIE